MGVLRRLLRLWSAAGAKVLLFSQSVRMLAILEQVHSAAESAPINAAMPRAAARRRVRWSCR
jgi:SNF2 family DNA or RNA helicase